MRGTSTHEHRTDTDQRFGWIGQHGVAFVDWAGSSAFQRPSVMEGMKEWFSPELDDASLPLSISKHVTHVSSGAKPALWNSTLSNE